MIDTARIMDDRETFTKTAIEKAGLLPLGEMTDCKGHLPVEKLQVLATGEIICPVCYLAGVSDENMKRESDIQIKNFDDTAKKYRFLYRNSIFQNKNLLGKGLKDYKATTKEQKENKRIASTVVSKLVGGSPLNIILTGGTGCGKTHLAIAIGVNVNEMSNRNEKQKTVLFYSFSKLLNMIRDGYNNPSFKSEKYYMDLAEKADLLIIDDLGQEFGSEVTKRKSEFSNKILFSLLDSREEKATIITSNLSLETLELQYDPRIISRLKMNRLPITFTETEDYRTKLLI